MGSNQILLPEIILKVVKYLEGYPETLHSCILVNREWCKITIPILWCNTFKKYNHNGHTLRRKQIISAYLTELSEESIILLKKHEIELPEARKTLFNYSGFLRYLDTYYLEAFVCSWLYFMTKDDLYNPNLSKAMSVNLLNYFLQQSQRLISLKFGNPNTMETALQYNSINCLLNLKSLRQYNNVHPATTTLFLQLSKCARNIENLDVAIRTQMSELSTLISVQRNLKRLSIRNKGTISSSTEPWINSMARSATSLTHLKLIGVNFPLEALYQFENLIELELKTCGLEGYSQEDLFHFTKVSLKHLETFHFESKYPIYLEPFVGLIRSSGENLKSLVIHGCEIEDPENAQQLIISLTDHSPNLIYYEGPILEDNTYELEAMLNQCTQLRKLLLHPSIPKCFYPTPSIDFDPLFNVITNNKTHKLKELILIHAWQISEDALLGFFKTHEKKNSGSIKFNYDKYCTVFHGIGTICSKYNDAGVGLGGAIVYRTKLHL